MTKLKTSDLSARFMYSEDSNGKLCQLLREIAQNQDGSYKQQQAMEQLLALIPKLQGIYKNQDRRFKDDDYKDGMNLALAAVCYIGRQNNKITGENIRRFINKRNLDIYDSEPGIFRKYFVQWFNRILKNKIADLFRQNGSYLSLDFSTNSNEYRSNFARLKICFELPSVSNLSGFERLIDEEYKSNYQTFSRYITEDLDGRLKQCYPDGYPQANCQQLTRMRYLNQPPSKWKDIANNLNVPQGTVTSHWNRRCKPLLKEVFKEISE